jgi:glc operon protein GlcG
MDKLSLQTVKELLDHAVQKITADYRRPACVSLCDENGFLLGFHRMDGGPIRSIQISQSTAYTAIRMGVSTDAFLERLRKDNISIQYFMDPLLTALPGGSLLKDKNGKIVGAAGVSGLATSEDQLVTNDLASLVSAL